MFVFKDFTVLGERKAQKYLKNNPGRSVEHELTKKEIIGREIRGVDCYILGLCLKEWSLYQQLWHHPRPPPDLTHQKL